MASPLLLNPGTARMGNKAFVRGAHVQARPVAPRRRAGRALAQAVSARASSKAGTAYICVDCGYIYDGSEGPFEKLPNGYRCPVCSAPKRRFKPYAGGTGRNDSKSMNARWEKLQQGEGLAKGGGGGGGVNSGAFIAAGAVALAALAGLYAVLNSAYSLN